MMTTLQWLQCFGFLYVLFGLAMMINPHTIREALEELPHNKAAMFSLSIFSLLLGTIIIVTHSVYHTTAGLIVTLFGWMALLKGFAYLTYPHYIDKFKPMFSDEHKIKIIGIVTWILGGTMLAYCTIWW